MSQSRRSQVAAALSHYLGIGQSELFRRLELRRDLGLEPLDLVLFVLDFEETGGLAFPFEELEHATTVGALVELLTGWLEDYDREERLALEDEPEDSGAWSTGDRASVG